MSAIGPKQTWADALHMSAFRGKADMTRCTAKCPLVTQSGHQQAPSCRPGRAATIFPFRGEAKMKRRESLLLLGGCAAWCFSVGRVFAQQAAKVPRVGVLVSASEPHPFAEALRRG